MRKAILAAVILGLCLAFAGAAKAEKKQITEDAVSKHMIAEATLIGALSSPRCAQGGGHEQKNTSTPSSPRWRKNR